MTWMLKNSRGRPDALLTVAVATVATVLLKVLAGGLQVGPVHIGPALDGGTIAALLTPTLGAYTAKRISKADRPAEVK